METGSITMTSIKYTVLVAALLVLNVSLDLAALFINSIEFCQKLMTV